MNRIAVNSQDFSLPSWSKKLESYAKKVLEEAKLENWNLSILICGDKTIKELNTQYRNRAEVTDVLSFELGEEICENGEKRYLAGDIVISLDTLKENSKYFQTAEDEELRRLLIHGILHLRGMEHKTNDSAEPMLKLQEDILKKLENEKV